MADSRQYQLQCTIEIQHSFYADMVCHDITLQPSKATSELMRNSNCLFKQRTHGIQLFCLQNNSTNQKPLTLTFYLFVKNQKFYNITDLPIAETNDSGFYSFQNRSGESALSKRPSVTKADQLPLRPARFTHRLDEKTSSDFEIRSNSGKTVQKITLTDSEEILIDISSETEGVYNLWNNGETLFVWYSSLENFTTPPWGVLTLELTAVKEDEAPPVYQLSFNARKAIWRYFIIDKREDQQVYLSIECSEISREFKDMGVQELADGSEARLFSLDSQNPIPFEENSKKKINLMSGSKTLMSHLPIPSPESIQMIREDDGIACYADAYVYI